MRVGIVTVGVALVGVLAVLFLWGAWEVEWRQRRATRALLTHDVRIVLLALDEYRLQHGAYPTALAQLPGGWVADVDLSRFTYHYDPRVGDSPEVGAVAADGEWRAEGTPPDQVSILPGKPPKR